MNINDLVGKKVIKVEQRDEDIAILTEDGYKFHFNHHQDCCESVTVEDVVGDWNDLVGEVITLAEEVYNEQPIPDREWVESYTWTYYKFASVKGYVDVRWLGESNGYYSESVDLDIYKLEDGKYVRVQASRY
ncbi:MAG TPA: hypothetical protein VFM18_20895 [Methanosarcina sp.]|nr:hypothetical protein [Methanosarcina sp.]